MLRNSFRFSHLTNFTTIFFSPPSTHYGKEQEGVEVPSNRTPSFPRLCTLR